MKLIAATLLSFSMFAAALTGCSGQSTDDESSSQSPDVHEASSDLQALGVHYFEATGTAENATFTLYDKGHTVIGGGRVFTAKNSVGEITWKGVRWELGGTEDSPTLAKNGVSVDAETATDYLQAEDIATRTIEQANLPSAVATAQACLKQGARCGAWYKASNKCCSKLQCLRTSVFSHRCY